MFLTKRLERCLCRSDFGKGAWITLGLEAVFSRNMRRNTCFLIGGLISFDYSLQGGRRTSYPKLIWGMSVYVTMIDGGRNPLFRIGLDGSRTILLDGDVQQ